MGDPETGDSIDDKMFNFTFGGDTSLHIMPATEGLKNSKGLFAVIIGTVLLAVATAGASLAAEGAGVGLTAEFSTYAIGSAGLGITGVVWRLWMWDAANGYHLAAYRQTGRTSDGSNDRELSTQRPAAKHRAGHCDTLEYR